MVNGNILNGDAPVAERPTWLKFAHMLGFGFAAGVAGYFIGKLLAGSSDFAPLQIAMFTAAIVYLGWAARDALNKGAKLGKMAMQTLLGAAFGAGSVLLVYHLLDGQLKHLAEDATGWQVATGIVGLIYLAFALILTPMGFSKKLPSSEPLTETEIGQWHAVCRWSALVTFAYAAAVLALLAGSLQQGSGANWPALGGVVLAMGVQIGGTLMLWKVYDELWRDATKDACAVAFVIFEVALFIWAALSIAGLGVAFDPLGVIVLFSAIYLGASLYFTFKRGMDQM